MICHLVRGIAKAQNNDGVKGYKETTVMEGTLKVILNKILFLGMQNLPP